LAARIDASDSDAGAPSRSGAKSGTRPARSQKEKRSGTGRWSLTTPAVGPWTARNQSRTSAALLMVADSATRRTCGGE